MHLYLKCRVTTARQWNSLEQVYSASSQARIMNFRLQLQTMSKDGSIVEEYVIQLKTVTDRRWCALGEKILNIDLVLYGLRGLDLFIICLSLLLL